MKNVSFHYDSTSSALILISLHLKCLVFKFPFTTYFAFPTLNSVWAQMRTLLKRTAEGEDGEKSGLIIYHCLWKEKGNKLPTDLLSLETIEAEKQTTLAMALCTMPICLWIIPSLIVCSLSAGRNQWERQGHPASGYRHTGGREGHK